MSPMDTTDYDRIQAIVDRAIEPINAQMKLMMPKDESLSRHLATADRVANIEKRTADTTTSIGEVVKWAMGEHAQLRQGYESRIDKLESNADAHFQSIETSVESIKQSISEGRATTIRYMVGVVVSFFLGSGIIGLIEFFVTRH